MIQLAKTFVDEDDAEVITWTTWWVNHRGFPATTS